jgi:hypothetical protein
MKKLSSLILIYGTLMSPVLFADFDKITASLKQEFNKIVSPSLSKDLTIVPTNEHPQKLSINTNKALFKIGEFVNINVTTGEAGCLTLWDKGTSGNWLRLFPNQHKNNCMLPAGKHVIGKKEYGFKLSGPIGQETLYAVWTKNKREQPSGENLINQPNESLTKDLTPVLRQDRSQWATAKTTFTVTHTGVVNRTAIGVSSYQAGTQQKVYILAMGSNVGDLVQSNHDATNFKKGMKAIYPQAITKFIKNVTVSEFKRGMQWLKNNVSPSDLVMIFYSGHGSTVIDDNGDEKDGYDEVFVTYDARNGAASADNVVRDDQFATWVNAINSDNIITFIDACHSGGLQKSFLTDAKIKSFRKGDLGTGVGASQNFAESLDHVKGLVLAAAGEDENALEFNDGGLFVNSLLTELGKAQPGDNLLTIFNRSKSVVSQRSKGKQIPVTAGNHQIAEKIVLK